VLSIAPLHRTGTAALTRGKMHAIHEPCPSAKLPRRATVDPRSVLILIATDRASACRGIAQMKQDSERAIPETLKTGQIGLTESLFRTRNWSTQPPCQATKMVC
jgi:hypothetical protein